MTLKRTTPLKSNSQLQRKTPMPRASAKKKPAAKKPKHPTATDYKRWCDQLFSLIIRSRGRCERCGTTMNLQCSHVVSRRYLATRWAEDGAICACRGCHHWQHMRPLENEAWLVEQGHDFEGIKQRALALTKPDYPTLFRELVERADELEIETAKFKKHLPPS